MGAVYPSAMRTCQFKMGVSSDVPVLTVVIFTSKGVRLELEEKSLMKEREKEETRESMSTQKTNDNNNTKKQSITRTWWQSSHPHAH